MVLIYLIFGLSAWRHLVYNLYGCMCIKSILCIKFYITVTHSLYTFSSCFGFIRVCATLQSLSESKISKCSFSYANLFHILDHGEVDPGWKRTWWYSGNDTRVDGVTLDGDLTWYKKRYHPFETSTQVMSLPIVWISFTCYFQVEYSYPYLHSLIRTGEPDIFSLETKYRY